MEGPIEPGILLCTFGVSKGTFGSLGTHEVSGGTFLGLRGLFGHRCTLVSSGGTSDPYDQFYNMINFTITN